MDDNQLNYAGYPSDLFEVPEEFIREQELRTLHAEVCARLLSDQPDADMLDVLIIERVATSYFYLRQKEHGPANDRTYRSLTKMWLEIATELRKKRLESMSEVAIKDKVTTTIVEALNSALNGVDPIVARVVRDRMVKELESV